MTEFNREFFEILFEYLDEPWDFSKRASQRYRYELTMGLLRKHQDRYTSVLDIGCAQGQLTKELLPFSDRITAIDISEKAIERVRRDFVHIPQISFEVGCLPTLNYSDQEFDMAMAFEILYYLKRQDIPSAIREIRRVLKENGLFFISVIIGNEPYFHREEIKKLVGQELQILEEKPIYSKLHQLFEARFFELKEKITIAKKLLSLSVTETRQLFDKAKPTKLRTIAEKILTRPILKLLIQFSFQCVYIIYRVLTYPLDLLFRSMKFLEICNYLTKKLWGEKGVFQVILVARKEPT